MSATDSTESITSREVWADIPDFPGYQVSDHGRVRSFLKRRGVENSGSGGEPLIKKFRDDCKGYPTVSLRKGGESITRKIHRLVLESFVGLMPEGMECCHGNGKRDDNRLVNLRWDTPKSNKRDELLHGTRPMFEKNGRSKLNKEKVTAIREMSASGKSYTYIGKLFGVARETIKRAVRRINWDF